MFITLKKHKEIIKNLENSLKADLIGKDDLIKRLLEEIVEKKQDIKELQQTLEKLEVK
jgi:ATP-dependent Clp protease ATP-binding subunit ClpA